MTFGEKCRKYRTAKNMTQEETAKAVGLSKRTYLYYESGEKMPRKRETIQKLADCFGVNINQLIVEDEAVWQQLQKQRPAAERMEELRQDIQTLLTEDSDEETEQKLSFIASVTALFESYTQSHQPPSSSSEEQKIDPASS